MCDIVCVLLLPHVDMGGSEASEALVLTSTLSLSHDRGPLLSADLFTVSFSVSGRLRLLFVSGKSEKASVCSNGFGRK